MGRLRLIFTFFSDYWGYFEPIRQFMPKNCSADVEAVIAHIDTVFSGNDKNQTNQILNLFGLGALAPHLDDAAGARTCPFALLVRRFKFADSIFFQYQFEIIFGTGNPCLQVLVPVHNSSSSVMPLKLRMA